ncbi:MAG: deoxyribonuclease IV [Rubrobacter sp.]|nr:deoxyribonuclease IV [Rubrobacter sp.]
MNSTGGPANGRTNPIGRHLQTSGGLRKTLRTAGELGCEAIQVFVSNPQGWAVPAPREDGPEFAAGAREAGISPVVVHSKYLINLASGKEEGREKSVRALAEELAAAGALGAELVVVHSGSHGGDGAMEGMERLVAGLRQARELSSEVSGETDGAVPAEPVLENPVGAGSQLCSLFGELGEAAERAGVRVCVDTAHAFVAGYDLSTPEGAAGVAEELRAALGERVAMFHLNDAKNELGSHRDGHRKLGEGQVPVASWTELLRAFPGVPAVMETPYDTPETDREEVELLKELAAGLPKERGSV